MGERAASIPIGRMAGYDVQGKLGAGGMGVVYKAVDLKLSRTVALKFLSDQDVTGDDRERLLREARAASALDHANIAAVHTIEETDDGRTFIVMGYYAGETLASKIRQGPMQPAHAVNIALQIAAGLQHAHARNIVHRDIKPSNVLITNDGTAKILDFGLARMHGPTASTESASLTGTLFYMPPEQIQGKPLDSRCDIWALGVVLYQMLTARLPFYTDNAASTINAILESAPAPMPTVSDELQLIILRALSKSPASRYQSCTEMIRDLEQVAVDDRTPTVTFDRSTLQKQLRSASQSAAPPQPLRISKRVLWVAVPLCLAVALGLALLIGPVRPRIFGPEEKHIVVLPFHPGSEDASAQSLADGLTETVAEKLSNLDAGKQSLWVVPSSEVRRRKIEDAKSASRELGATVAVTGRLIHTEQGIRLIMDVIDAKSMRLLGSASVDQALSSAASVDDDAVDRVASILGIGVRPSSGFDAKTLASAYEAYLQGRGYLQRFDKPGNVDNAIKLFESVVSADPKFALGFAALGEAYWDKYRLDQNPDWLKRANEYGSRAVQLNDKLPAVYTTIAHIHVDSGQSDLALSEFDQALKLDPRNADAHLGLAAVYEKLGRLADAEKELKTAITLRPEYWVGYTDLASFYFRQRRPADAAREYQRVIELVPDSANAHSNYGAMLSNMGQPQQAIAEFRKSLQIAETYAAYANLGILLYRQKNWTESAQATEKALNINPNDYRVWGNLGIAYEQMGDTAKANAAYAQELVHLEETAKVKGSDPAVQCELAVLYSKKKDSNEALRHLDAALARSPEDPRFLTDSAEVYENLGDRNRAVAQLNKALAKGWSMTKILENPGLRHVITDPRVRKQ